MKAQLRCLVLTGTLFIFLGVSCSQTGRQPSDNGSEVQPVDMHNSQSSLDWQGSYRGILPCADCSGIETVIDLDADNTYRMSQKYIDKDSIPRVISGSFTWTKDGNKIVLGKENDNRRLQVGENQLFWMDNEGNRITGALAEQYRLVKQ
ncbi:MAG TPA: copper resistance protein NlpE [Agriterribacter sp.]|nr:copper resistance protein NlpE [Agriterribacter sp.]